MLQAQDDVYTSHIHADDLARAVLAALWRGRPQRIYHAADDTELKMGDYFDLAADLYGLPRPRRLPRSTAEAELPLMLLSFMSESRRLDNRRLKQELRLRLWYPTVESGLRWRGAERQCAHPNPLPEGEGTEPGHFFPARRGAGVPTVRLAPSVFDNAVAPAASRSTAALYAALSSRRSTASTITINLSSSTS